MAKKPEHPRLDSMEVPLFETQLSQLPDRYLYVPDFLSRVEAGDLFNRLASATFFIPEHTGHNDDGSGHDIAVFGRPLAAAKGHIRPRPIPAPQYLRDLKARLEAHLQTPFTALQINKHYDGRSKVHPHTDASPGHIAQVTGRCRAPFHLERP